MAKRLGDPTVVQELRKEYLKEHLDGVKSTVNRWALDLNAPPPFDPVSGPWGWQSAYRPRTELYPDNNHMLRRHVRSRALWRHHADWETKLDDIWGLTQQLRKEAVDIQVGQAKEQQWKHSNDYLNVALWKGFEKANGQDIEQSYLVPSDQLGLAYLSYKIEMSASSAEQRAWIQKGHWSLINKIAELNKMKDLVEIWRGASGLCDQMQSIAFRIVKSNDIIYACKFCRHLWGNRP